MVLVAYLLPFVKMSDYLMAAGVVCLVASVCLMYVWLKRRGFSAEICMGISLLFLLAGPMIYQSCHQIMFVQYMPFLMLALLGIDRYWEKGKTGLYTLGVFLMILTSFYFSIAGMAGLVLYGWYRSPEKLSVGKVIHFFVPMGVAVISGGVLLVPTACALLQRSGSSRSESLTDLLMPDLCLDKSLYNPYSVGLTMLLVTALLAGILCGKIRERLVSVIGAALLVLPVFAWGFNGALYVRYKSLIPFLPLFCYLIAVFLRRMKEGRSSVERSSGLCSYRGSQCAGLVSERHRRKCREIPADRAGECCALWLLYHFSKMETAVAFADAVAAVSVGYQLGSERRSRKSGTKRRLSGNHGRCWGEEIGSVLQAETGLYRTEQSGVPKKRKDNVNRVWNMRQWITSVYSSAYNQEFQDFREKTFQIEQPFRNGLMQTASADPLFQKFMGVKYVIGRSEDGESFTSDIQEHVAPVIYGTSQLLSEKTYQTMEFPYNQTMLMQYAVTEDGHSSDTGVEKTKGIRKENVSFTAKKGLTGEGDSWNVQTKKEQKATLLVDGEKESSKTERILYLQFDVENAHSNKDVSITIDGIRNKLTAKNHLYYNGNTTFTYVMKLSAKQKKVKVTLGAGTYRICNLKSYSSGASILEDDTLYQSTFTPDWNTTGGNQISGSIDMKQNGYLITSIPYDSHLEVRIDGREVVTEKVNTAFLGCRMLSGEHWVTITYHAPGLAAGKWISLIGLLGWGVMIVAEKKKKDERQL